MTKLYFFVDLDNTLFQTNRSGTFLPDLEVAAVARDGSPLSFTTAKQRALFQWLCSGGVVIPITARNYSAFTRVKLSFPSKIAIINFGGIVLNTMGELDLSYHHNITSILAPIKPLLVHLKKRSEQLVERYQLSIRSRIITDFDVSFYLEYNILDPLPTSLKNTDYSNIDHSNIDHKNIDRDSIDDFYQILREEVLCPFESSGDFYIHKNRNHLAILPKIVSKDKALHYVVEQYIKQEENEPLCIGIGDSLSDLCFMTACDYCMSPSLSQIVSHLSNLSEEQL